MGVKSGFFWKIFFIFFFKVGLRKIIRILLKKINNFYIGNFFFFFLNIFFFLAPVKEGYSFENRKDSGCSPLFKKFLNTKVFSNYLNFKKSLKIALKYTKLDFKYTAKGFYAANFIFFFEQKIFRIAPARLLLQTGSFLLFNFPKLQQLYSGSSFNYLSNILFNLNKWPIDKAPKVSSSSYLVGVGFVILFHIYGYTALDGFFFFSYFVFGNPLQVSSLLLLLVLGLFFFLSGSDTRIGKIVLILWVLFIIVFFYFNGNILISKLYPQAYLYVSNYLVISYDFYLFFFFFMGWSFKVSRKYSLESYTSSENNLYQSILPSLYIFEVFTFVYLIIWRFVVATLAGYPTIMFLKVYKFQNVTSFFITKYLFYGSILIGALGLLLAMKILDRDIFLFLYFCFLVYLSWYVFSEFSEFLAALQEFCEINVSKFTYFKFISYIQFFNFLHAYGVLLFSAFGLLHNCDKTNFYKDSFWLMYINIKNLYFIAWLSFWLVFTIYLAHEIHFYLPFCEVLSYFV